MAPSIPYTVGLADDASFVVYRAYRSARSGSELADRLRAIVALATEHQLTRLMLDVRDTVFRASIATQYEYAYHQARKVGLLPQWRIALVVTPAERSYDFLETALINAGYVARLFHEPARAADWLKGSGGVSSTLDKLPF